MSFAVFGAGCFWCVETIFLEAIGVIEVTSGYTGGNIPNPTYEQICTGETGHAEVCKIVFDPKITSFESLLKIFWENHDSTTLNKQGADIGNQYRSAIFFTDESQRIISEKYKKQLNKKGIFNNTIVTEIEQLNKFYIAEDYHQNYYSNNINQPYCKFIIKPKLDKFINNMKK